MNKLFPILLLPLCGLALAEDNDIAMMPDGSRDMYVGMALTSRSAAEAGEPHRLSLRPLLQVEWSNGIFASANGVVGMHLSNGGPVAYGPLLAASNSRDPSESRRLRGSHAIDGSVDAGGYFDYYLGYNTRLGSSIMYDRSARGWRGEFGVQKSWNDLAPHHTLSVSAGVSLAGDAVMRERYEVSRAAGGARDYTPSGGLASAGVGVHWNYALSSKWLLSSSASARRLGGEAAASPVVERRNFFTISSGLAYRF